MGGLAGKFVGFALLEEGRINEGAVVEAEGIDNALLGFTFGAAGEELVIFVGGAAAVEFEFAAVSFAVIIAKDAVFTVVELKAELDAHVVGVEAEEVGIGSAAVAGFAGFAPDRPGHGLEEGGFSMSIPAGEAREMEGSEVQGGAVFTIGQKVTEG